MTSLSSGCAFRADRLRPLGPAPRHRDRGGAGRHAGRHRLRERGDRGGGRAGLPRRPGLAGLPGAPRAPRHRRGGGGGAQPPARRGGRGRARGRQGRAPREADGHHARGLRPAARGGPRQRPRAERGPRAAPVHPVRPGQGPHRRGRDRHAVLHTPSPCSASPSGRARRAGATTPRGWARGSSRSRCTSSISSCGTSSDSATRSAIPGAGQRWRPQRACRAELLRGPALPRRRPRRHHPDAGRLRVPPAPARGGRRTIRSWWSGTLDRTLRPRPSSCGSSVAAAAGSRRCRSGHRASWWSCRSRPASSCLPWPRLLSGEEARKRIVVCVGAEAALREGREIALRFSG